MPQQKILICFSFVMEFCNLNDLSPDTLMPGPVCIIMLSLQHVLYTNNLNDSSPSMNHYYHLHIRLTTQILVLNKSFRFKLM